MPENDTAENADMPTPRKVQGLCLNCNHAATCVVPAQSSAPVWHCNEHECLAPYCPPSKPKTDATPAATPGKPDACEKNLNHLMGLCTNCDNQASCTLPRPESGVWQCNEYQ